MAKKHIIGFAGTHFATDSISAANDAIRILSKLVRCKIEYVGDVRAYVPDTSFETLYEINLALNQEFIQPAKPKKEKPLALPKPKRGSIMCICEHSHVAPNETCPHCGRPFSESHSRTHGSDHQHGEHLRLI